MPSYGKQRPLIGSCQKLPENDGNNTAEREREKRDEENKRFCFATHIIRGVV